MKDAVDGFFVTKNVFDFKLLVNEELMNLENDIKFFKGDKIMVRISRDDIEAPSEVTLIGYDPEVAVDGVLPELYIDEPIDEEHILVNPNENNIN